MRKSYLDSYEGKIDRKKGQGSEAYKTTFSIFLASDGIK